MMISLLVFYFIIVYLNTLQMAVRAGIVAIVNYFAEIVTMSITIGKNINISNSTIVLVFITGPRTDLLLT